MYDDSVPTDGKSTVIDVYYKKYSGGKKVLHYCKYVGDTLLYSTENTAQSMAGSEEMAQALPGLYEHGLYPFVFDSLFPVEGSPCGYGFIDLCQNSQTQIDMMQTAFVKNTIHNTPGRGNTLRNHRRDIPRGERLHLHERNADTDSKGHERQGDIRHPLRRDVDSQSRQGQQQREQDHGDHG